MEIVTVFLLAGALSVLISLSYVTRQRLQATETYGLMLFAVVGMMIMGGTHNLIIIFLGLEVMSISIYALAAMNRRDRKSAEAGLKYFLLGAFSTGFFLYGIALLYGATGSTDIAAMSRAALDGSAAGPLLLFGVALLAIGFGYAFEITEWLQPGSIKFAEGEPEVLDRAASYFSLVTLTTVGYGDVTPVSPLARRIAMFEGFLGQLYPAIIIGWMVGSMRRRED